MPGDLALAVEIASILDARGFEELKLRLGELASQQARTGEGAKGLGGAMELMGSRLPRQQFRFMTADLLLATGAFSGAGREVSALSHVVTSLALGLPASIVAMAAVASVASLVAEKMNQDKEATAKLKAESEKLVHSNDDLVQRLKQQAAVGTQLEPVLRNLISAHAELDRIQARETLTSQTQLLFATRQNIQALEDQIAVVQREGAAAIEGASAAEAKRNKIAELSGQLPELRARERALTADVEAQTAAMRRGVKTADDLLAADQERLAFGKSMLAQAREMTDAFIKASFRENQLEHDREQNARRELDRQRAEDRGRAQEAERQERRQRRQREIGADVAEADAENELAIRQHKKETFDNTAQLLAAAFPKQKNFAIALATINTLEGATTVLRDPTLPFFLKFAAAAAVIAFGFEQVKEIRAQAAGFDLAESDLLARRRGFKWADDLLRHIDSGFEARLSQRVAPGGSVINNVTRNTTINRGPVFGGGINVSGIFGAGKTEMIKVLNREIIRIGRLEDRTKLA